MRCIDVAMRNSYLFIILWRITVLLAGQLTVGQQERLFSPRRFVENKSAVYCKFRLLNVLE